MSTHWMPYCHTCKSCGYIPRINHGLQTIQWLIKNAQVIAAMGEVSRLNPSFVDITVNVGREVLDLQWFAQHSDHKLGAISEYGETD